MSISELSAESHQDSQLQGSAALKTLAERSAAALVYLAVLTMGSPEDEAGIAYGEMVATSFGAHLDVYLANHIAIPPIPAGPGSASLADLIFQQNRQTGDGVEKCLRERLSRLGIPWELRRDDGSAGELATNIVRLAGTCDLFVISQDATKNTASRDLLEAVMFEAGSSVLLVPQGLAFDEGIPKTILVGWRDTPECAHAIAAALPFLQRAETVVLVSVTEDEAAEECSLEPMADMARHLARHDVKIETRELPHWHHASDALLNEAKAVAADLIVIGAYGHSRMREFLLGGVTKNLLRESGVPLLLAH